MSGQLIGALILWLIIAIIAIAIIVYLVNWLYRRSSKEAAFVRTGLAGEKVVIDSGAFVLPFIHDITPVNMNVLQMRVHRGQDDAIITRDRMRVDIDADFYVRVRATAEAVSLAASTLGRRTMQPETLHALLSGKFVSDPLGRLRDDEWRTCMNNAVSISPRSRSRREALAKNGLELESVALPISTRPTCNISTPERFDAEGLPPFIEQIEGRARRATLDRFDDPIPRASRIGEQSLELARERTGATEQRATSGAPRRARAEIARERAMRTEAEQPNQCARGIEKSGSSMSAHHRSEISSERRPPLSRAQSDRRPGRDRRTRDGGEARISMNI